VRNGCNFLRKNKFQLLHSFSTTDVRGLFSACSIFVIIFLIVDGLSVKNSHLAKVALSVKKNCQEQLNKTCTRLTYLIDGRGIRWQQFYVSDLRRYVYCSIPKAACSSWKQTLFKLAGKDVSNVELIHTLRITDKIVTRLVHYNYSQKQKVLKQYYKFTFVREPLERLLSTYLDKCVGNDRHFRWVSRAVIKHSRQRNKTRTGETAEHVLIVQ